MKILVRYFSFACCFLFMAQSFNLVYAQEKVLSARLYTEKIYLQLSSSAFAIGESVWFKAIVTQGPNNAPSALSSVLHVELIDFDKRVVDKKKLKLNGGIAHNRFQLPDTYASGRYLIRAYTEWNRNFGQDFFFSEYIDIHRPEITKEPKSPIKDIVFVETGKDSLLLSAQLQPQLIDPKFKGKLQVFYDIDGVLDSLEVRKREGVYILQVPVSKKAYVAKIKVDLKEIRGQYNEARFVNSYSRSIVIDKHRLDLQFFPEGGQLLDGVHTKVALKAIDYSGRGRQVSGQIVDGQDNVVANFNSNALGMGTVSLKGDVNRMLFAKITGEDGTVYKYPIPKAMVSGYALKVTQGRNLINMEVESRNQKDSLIHIAFESRGVRYGELKLKHQNDITSITTSAKTLPEGIIKLTVLNQNHNIFCERLFFNSKPSDRIDLEVTSDRQTYFQRDKTKLQVANKTNEKDSLSLNTSILVLNKDLLQSNTKPNILSYFLLSSELKGHIENPNQYFDINNPNRYKDLEALMLTQGWRSYKYDSFDENINYKYQPEKGLTISGNIGEMFNRNLKKEYKEANVSLMTLGDPISFFVKDMDSTGLFRFSLQDTYEDELKFAVQIKTKKGKKKDYTVNIDKTNLPEILLEKDNRFLTEDTLIKKQYIEKIIEHKIAGGELDTSGNVIQLDEVELSGYVLTPQREKMMKLHGPPDVVIEGEELKEKIGNGAYTLYQVLQSYYPHDIRIRGAHGELFATVNGADYTYYILDGIPVQITYYPILSTLPAEDIKSVEILRKPKNRGVYFIKVGRDPSKEKHGYDAFISIYTHAGNGQFGVQKRKGIHNGAIKGFTPKQEFYTPKYDDIENYDWEIPDFRSVVYWNPEITPNKNGEYIVDYYNGDDMGEMLIIIETISKDGKIGYSEFTYKVEENSNR